MRADAYHRGESRCRPQCRFTKTRRNQCRGNKKKELRSPKQASIQRSKKHKTRRIHTLHRQKLSAFNQMSKRSTRCFCTCFHRRPKIQRVAPRAQDPNHWHPSIPELQAAADLIGVRRNLELTTTTPNNMRRTTKVNQRRFRGMENKLCA